MYAPDAQSSERVSPSRPFQQRTRLLQFVKPLLGDIVPRLVTFSVLATPVYDGRVPIYIRDDCLVSILHLSRNFSLVSPASSVIWFSMYHRRDPPCGDPASVSDACWERGARPTGDLGIADCPGCPPAVAQPLALVEVIHHVEDRVHKRSHKTDESPESPGVVTYR